MLRLAAWMQSPVFLVNSRLGLFTAAAEGSPGKQAHLWRRPFSRSYGAILPSSLTMVLPIASVCSTRPPVSVLVRAPTRLPRGFSRKHGMTGFDIVSSSRVSGNVCLLISMQAPPTRFHGDVQNPARLPFSVAPLVIAVSTRHGNIHPLCVGYGFRPRLSSRLTLGGRTFPRKPQTFDGGVSRSPLATYAGILSSIKSTAPFDTASALIDCSSTDVPCTSLNFGDKFSPDKSSAHHHSTSELLRTL